MYYVTQQRLWGLCIKFVLNYRTFTLLPGKAVVGFLGSFILLYVGYFIPEAYPAVPGVRMPRCALVPWVAVTLQAPVSMWHRVRGEWLSQQKKHFLVFPSPVVTAPFTCHPQGRAVSRDVFWAAVKPSLLVGRTGGVASKPCTLLTGIRSLTLSRVPHRALERAESKPEHSRAALCLSPSPRRWRVYRICESQDSPHALFLERISPIFLSCIQFAPPASIFIRYKDLLDLWHRFTIISKLIHESIQTLVY